MLRAFPRVTPSGEWVPVSAPGHARTLSGRSRVCRHLSRQSLPCTMACSILSGCPLLHGNRFERNKILEKQFFEIRNPPGLFCPASKDSGKRSEALEGRGLALTRI